MSAIQQANVLGGRSLREAWRTPEALAPTLFIPVFFLIVNFGQAGKIFPSDSTGFLHGQTYAAFQLPISLLLAASFGSAALFLVEDIEDGYFDKLRAAPVSRSFALIGECPTFHMIGTPPWALTSLKRRCEHFTSAMMVAPG